MVYSAFLLTQMFTNNINPIVVAWLVYRVVVQVNNTSTVVTPLCAF